MQTITITNDDRDLEIDGLRFMPVGSITCYAGDIAPTGWLLCDGAEKSQTTYSRLYSVLGSKYGAASTGHFKLPNMTNKFPLGKSSSNTLGHTGGSNTVTLLEANMPAHTHTVTVDSAGTHSHTATDSGHTHTYDDAYFAENRGAGYPNDKFGTSAGTDSDNSFYYRSGPVTNTGHANISVDNNGSHSHSATIDSTGSGSSFDVTNPYIVLNYIIRY
jgi:microcystin-dependent protein